MNKYKNILITGGAGFIGGALIRNLLHNYDCKILNLDKLSYASDLSSISSIQSSLKRHKHLKINLISKDSVQHVIDEFKPNLILHCAAESHVDRSINDPSNFIESNIIGTFNLVECARNYWQNLNSIDKEDFRFHHISTDEVFGTLNKNQDFNELSRYSPRSPYSASKASSDHIVMSWFHTFGLPTVITNCSNNYGPYQFPEKLIPLVILKALNGELIPIYGDGKNERDWLYVNDHIDAIIKTLECPKIGETYCIGSNSTKTNLEVVEAICGILDRIKPTNESYKSLISFVKDRPGHDRRYSINNNKISSKLNWSPKYTFEEGLERTVDWYMSNLDWCKKMLGRSGYLGERLGL